METTQIEVWVLVDSTGDYGVGRDADEATASYDNDIGGTPAGSRLVKVVLTVPLPQPVVMTGTVPAEACEGAELTVA